MFNAHNINSNNLSVKNLILLFFTIVLGFASVITLAQIEIPSTIQNAWQTIAKISITASGTDSTPLIEMSSGGIFIDPSILTPETNFSGKILGIDDLGNLIYVYSQNLVTSGGGGGGGDTYWTGVGSDIYNSNLGNVGINTPIMSGKLHIKSSAETELYLQETSPGNAANINFKSTSATIRGLGGDSSPDIFYIGLQNGPRYFSIKPTGNVGIGSGNTDPKANLQVIGTFIAGDYSNTVSGTNSSIAGGRLNYSNGNNVFIGGGLSNSIDIIVGEASAIAGGAHNHITGELSFVGGGVMNNIYGNEGTIGGGRNNNISGAQGTIGGGRNNNISGAQGTIGGGLNNSITGNLGFIGGGSNNTIGTGSDYSSIVGGFNNKIGQLAKGFIGGGENNTITGSSSRSAIAGGNNNYIEDSTNSFVGGRYARAIKTPNTFVRNSTATPFIAAQSNTFIINAPGGVGIGTNNPKGALDISGNGLLILKPQTTNGNGCSIQGAIHYNDEGSSVGGYLCYCDGANRRQVQDNTLLCI